MSMNHVYANIMEMWSIEKLMHSYLHWPTQEHGIIYAELCTCFSKIVNDKKYSQCFSIDYLSDI